MARIVKELVDVGTLDDTARVHDEDLIRHGCDNAEIMGDQQERRAHVALQVVPQRKRVLADGSETVLSIERERPRIFLPDTEPNAVAFLAHGLFEDVIHQLLSESLAIPGYSDIIPVGYNPAAPVGTGPFRLKSFSPGTQSTFVRYGGYWQTGVPYLDEVVITDYADQTSQVNALLAGQVDVVNLLSADVISEVQGEGKNILLSDGGGWRTRCSRSSTTRAVTSSRSSRR